MLVIYIYIHNETIFKLWIINHKAATCLTTMAVWLLGQQRHPNDEGCSCTSNKAYSPNTGIKVEKKVSVAVCQWHCKNRSNRSQEKNSMFIKNIKRRIDTRTIRRCYPVLFTSKPFSFIHSILALRRVEYDPIWWNIQHGGCSKWTDHTDRPSKSEQGKREDTTFSITTPIAPAGRVCPELMEQMEGSKVFLVILWEEEVSQRIQQEHHDWTEQEFIFSAIFELRFVGTHLRCPIRRSGRRIPEREDNSPF